MDINEMAQYLETKTLEEKLWKKVVARLDECCIRHLKVAVPEETYDVWLNQYNFGIYEVESAIMAAAGRKITGGVDGVIKYVSRILWNRRHEAGSSRGEVAGPASHRLFNTPDDVPRDDDAF